MTDRDPIPPENRRIAGALNETASLLEEQSASPFQVAAYRSAAAAIAVLTHPVSEILARDGERQLDALPGVGPRTAAAIRRIAETGAFPMLERLRAQRDPERTLRSFPGIGPKLARRVVERLHPQGLEDLELAAHAGQLESIPGLGPKRAAGIRDVLAGRLAGRPPVRSSRGGSVPIAELLDVDREYRERAGSLPHIAPRRFNPAARAWLPVLHTERGDRRYTALYSNTAQAHRFGRTHDWVVIYFDGPEEGRATVVTARNGVLRGRRVVRGRETECAKHYDVWREPVGDVLRFDDVRRVPDWSMRR
jgi:endonuclease III